MEDLRLLFDEDQPASDPWTWTPPTEAGHVPKDDRATTAF
jgi:hypothetical protein